MCRGAGIVRTGFLKEGCPLPPLEGACRIIQLLDLSPTLRLHRLDPVSVRSETTGSGGRSAGIIAHCVLRFGLLQHGKVGVGVFPDGEEVLIGGAGPGGVALQGVRSRQSEAGQGAPGKVDHQSPVVDEFLKFRCRSVAVA